MLTKRLKYIVDSIPRCAVLADVGCDHGYVGIEALKRGVADEVIFCDISSACLDKARTNCPAGLKARASFICQDGLGETDCDVAVICGMGGLEILSVLNNAKRLPEAIVLQPMRNIVDTRLFVAEHYTLTSDVTVYDGKFYSVMVGERLGCPTREMTELEKTFGLTNMTDPSQDFIEYLQNEQAKLTAILRGCQDAQVSRKLALTNGALQQLRRKL